LRIRGGRAATLAQGSRKVGLRIFELEGLSCRIRAGAERWSPVPGQVGLGFFELEGLACRISRQGWT
jgi:hypothetical protein